MSKKAEATVSVVPDSEEFTTSGSESPVPSKKRKNSRKLVRTSSRKSERAGSVVDSNGFLTVPGKTNTRDPSPLGIIPIHTTFRSFIHRHEIPRKALHVSIGFLTLSLYAKGFQSDQIHPVLLSALIPITTADILRHNFPSLNKAYIRICGALMRESEVDGYNGVIWYLAGTWAVLRFFPKDIGVMGILLLSWCDTAASTIGRLWGRYTWQVRRGKSFAGSAAALVVGVLTSWAFWGWAAPTFGAPGGFDVPPNEFAFKGALALPEAVKGLIGWGANDGKITGTAAVGVLSLWSGIAVSASEAVDIFGWDDNFTIPVLCGVGLWGFLKVFGSE